MMATFLFGIIYSCVFSIILKENRMVHMKETERIILMNSARGVRQT